MQRSQSRQDRLKISDDTAATTAAAAEDELSSSFVLSEMSDEDNENDVDKDCSALSAGRHMGRRQSLVHGMRVVREAARVCLSSDDDDVSLSLSIDDQEGEKEEEEKEEEDNESSCGESC